MNTASPFRHMLQQAEDELWLAFEKTKVVKHAGLTGSGRESAVGDFLSSQLPTRFAVAQGEAFDSKRQRSAQLDLVVYDQMTVKPLKIDNENQLLPAEALLAVIEVKSRLTREETRRCFDGAEKLGDLRPYGKEFVFSRAGGADASDKSPRCLFTIFAFESDLRSEGWPVHEWERLREVAIEKGVAIERIDRVLVLDRGLIVPPTCTGRRQEAVEAQKGLLREWFLHLTNFLVREAARRPPFEWQPYAGKPQTAGWIKLEGYQAPKRKPKPTKSPKTKKRLSRGSSKPSRPRGTSRSARGRRGR